MPTNQGHIVVQALLDHGSLAPADAQLLLQNARLACRSWARALAPHVKQIRVDLSAAAPSAAAATSAFPCARTVSFDLRAAAGSRPIDPALVRSTANNVGTGLWRTLTTVRIVEDDAGGDDDDSSNSGDAEEEASRDDDEAAPEPPPQQQQPIPRPNNNPNPSSSLPLLLTCGGRRGGSASDLQDVAEAGAARANPPTPPQLLRRWLVAEVARGATIAAAAAASATPPLLNFTCLDLDGGPLPRPRELKRLLMALPAPPRALRLAAPADTARRLSAAHAASSPCPLATLELVFRSAEGVPARPLVLLGDRGHDHSHLRRLALTYTGPPELAGSVQAFDASDNDDADADDADADDGTTAQPPPSLSHLTLDMVALPLIPRVFNPLSPNLTVLRLRQREPFTAAEAALIGRSCPGLVALALAPLPWGLVPLAVAGRCSRKRLRALDLGIVDGRGAGNDDETDNNASSDDDSDNDSSGSIFMATPAPRLARAPGSTLGLGLTASRTGSLVMLSSAPSLTPTATTTNTDVAPSTASLLKTLRHAGARLSFLSIDATRPLSLRPADIAAMGRACPQLQSLELGVRLENGTAGFGAAFPRLRSLSVRGARTEASDAWSPAEWVGGGGGGDEGGLDDAADAATAENADDNWSFWSRAPRHRRAVTDPVVLVPEDLPPTLESLEARDLWACVPATLETADGGNSNSNNNSALLLLLPTPHLRRLSLRYVGACPGCAPPLPVLRWPTGMEQQQQQHQQQVPATRRSSLRSSSLGGGGGSGSSAAATTTTTSPSSLRDWLLRPLLTLAEAALSPSPENDEDGDDADGGDDTTNDKDNDQQQQQQQQRRPRGGTAATTPQPLPAAPTLTFLPANAALPSLPPSAAGKLTALELALPCDGPCCACGGGSSCLASRGPRRRSSFTATAALPAAADAAAPLPQPPARSASSSGPLASFSAAAMKIGAKKKASATTTTTTREPPAPPPLRLTLHLPRATRRATSPDATANHLARALSASLPRALALASASAEQHVNCHQLRLLCHGDVRCGGESGLGCLGKEAALLRESAARRLAAAATAGAAAASAASAPAVVVDFVHDPLPHLSGFRGMQCSCRCSSSAPRRGVAT